ncbi:MAG: DNA methylase [Rubrivivax sp.]|nr:DNA methylase [Rubrivivax sp.]
MGPQLQTYADKPYPSVDEPSASPSSTLIHGDCLTVLPQLPKGSVNFVLTDPPYLVNYRSRDGRRVRNDDRSDWLEPSFAQIHRVLQPDGFAVSFYGWPHADKFLQAYRSAGFRVVGHLMFPKRYTSASKYLSYRHECAYLLAKGQPEYPKSPIPDVIQWSYTGNKLHPTQKPLGILTPLIETFCAPGGLVLDPFAGSGSTLVAARDAGRRFVGIELDADYYATAQQRLCAGKQ